MALENIFRPAQYNGGSMDGEWIQINMLNIEWIDPDGSYVELNMKSGAKLKVRWPTHILEVADFT